MATLEVGSVSVAADGTATGDGLALAIYEAEVEARASFIELLPGLGFPDASAPENDRLWATLTAERSNRLASVIVAAIFNGIDD
jgi:hypothetical protein